MSIISSSCDSDKDVVARRLATAHRAVDPGISSIYRLEVPGREGDPDEPIKLLEINPHTTVSGVVPVGLSTHPSSGIHYPSIVVEIHPSEFTQLQQGQITLPDGWVFDENKQL
ncbi:MAG: hypothetical protein WD894_26875 [Pirellulales bacterium]